ncbi:MAG: 2-hydroxyglutaryl-CoA dehydratase [Planctomycetes bacterium]|nr:2-hydroxyglutaryl-CoA dehydratase [Planctomycetota bacterium]
MIYAGIDAGSRTIKVVLMASKGNRIIASGIADQGIDQERLAMDIFKRLISSSGKGRKDISRIVATGYGRNAISSADLAVTEITCQAAGVRLLCPQARTVVEIGGQDSKLIRLEADGSVRDFDMNDRCAAGTGRFLELVAARLGVGLDKFGELAGRSENPAVISSMCAVFAETEIIGLLAGGASPADIAAGVRDAVASRLTALAGGRLDDPIVLTGGVAMIPGLADVIAKVLDRQVQVSARPQYTGAIGAAIIACSRPEHSP